MALSTEDIAYCGLPETQKSAVNAAICRHAELNGISVEEARKRLDEGWFDEDNPDRGLGPNPNRIRQPQTRVGLSPLGYAAAGAVVAAFGARFVGQSLLVGAALGGAAGWAYGSLGEP